jgi:molecular chaperone HscB
MQYFDVLGLAPRLALDLKDLEKRFYAKSRELHPDRFVRAPQAEQQRALELSSLLNDAYRTLREPIARAEYVLKNSGFDIGEQRSKDVPPELLEEVFELNMALEEADRPQIEAAGIRFEKLRAEIDQELAVRFGQWDQAPETGTLAQIRGLLNRRRYIENLLRDVNVHLSN